MNSGLQKVNTSIGLYMPIVCLDHEQRPARYGLCRDIYICGQIPNAVIMPDADLIAIQLLETAWCPFWCD
jgi:hypothetical protein